MPPRPTIEKPGLPRELRLIGLVILLIFAVVSAWQGMSPDTPDARVEPTPSTAPRATEAEAEPEAAATPQSETPADDLVVPGMSIYDQDGDLVYQGDINLAPTFDRIDRGESDPHDNDGAVFQNREGLLPEKERGYYREYVVRTPGLDSVGPQRLVLGAEGEAYYTPDHYASFIRIR
ncbi:MAG TPA: ribonuclease domain-containing protein [Anaerolineales bacterium]|nr:ribonuclease domain-containing protein [Anaerolineales bacterium]HRF47342.1 ribonuclease domain-containing protein [Anaerolineales bacterium]